MSDIFKKIIKEYSESLGFTISRVTGTKHWNVLRLYNPSENQYYIAKGILHIEGDEELGPLQMDIAFENERSILSKLPKWWGLYLKDSFKKDPFRVIITPEIPNCKWTLYKGNDNHIALKLYKQIEWLHSHKIAHNDLELKNILLSCDNKSAIIIDFEKATVKSSNAARKNDYTKLIENLNETKETKGIAHALEILAFPQNPSTSSKTRRKKSKTYKNNKL